MCRDRGAQRPPNFYITAEIAGGRLAALSRHRPLLQDTAQGSVVVLATQGRMEIGALAQVLLGVAVGGRSLAAVGMGMRWQDDRCGNGGCGNNREEIEVHLG